jgi:hypothetical protein
MLKIAIKTSGFILLFLLLSYSVPANATTYYFGGAKNSLSSSTDEVSAGYYDHTFLHSVNANLAAGNIKSGTTVFGILGTYSGGAGGTYGVPKTGQQPGLPAGTPWVTGDDCWYASPEAVGMDVGYPRGKGTWAAYNAARFTDNGDGTVTDNATGLMWVQDSTGAGCNNGVADNWENLMAFCEGLTFATYSDWRMPNINELLSINNFGATNPTSYTIFTNQIANYYWSSTTRFPNTGYAWSVTFSTGTAGTTIKSAGYPYVRPVRGGQ